MPDVTKSYLICATPRSGSTLLCERLILSGLAGNPNEWMLEATQPQAKELFGITASFNDPAYLHELVSRTSTPNGVFGAKLMWPAMEALLRGDLWNFKLSGNALGDSAALPRLHYIRISRRDKLRQAISFLIAHKTDYWHRLTSEERHQSRWPLATVREELGDPERRRMLLAEIAQCLEEIHRQDRAWERFFRDERIAFHDIAYEELVADPHGETRRALDFIGHPIAEAIDFSRAQLLPMSDGINELLIEAFEDHAPAAPADQRSTCEP